MKRNRLLSMVLVVTMLLSVFQGALPVMGATSSMVDVDASAENWTTVGLTSSDVTGGASFTCDAAAYGTRAILNTQLDVTEAVEFDLQFTKEAMASGSWFAITFGQDADSFNTTQKGTTFLMYWKADQRIQCDKGSGWKVYDHASVNTLRFVKESDSWALYLKGATENTLLGEVSFDVFPANGFTNNKATFGVYVYGAERFACLSGKEDEVIGRFGEIPCMIMKNHGQGKIIYCGTNLGEAADFDVTAFEQFVVKVAELSGVKQNPFTAHRGVHIDKIGENIIVVNNSSETNAKIKFDGEYQGIFFGSRTVDREIVINKNCAEIFKHI